jgi:hypothetical protein
MVAKNAGWSPVEFEQAINRRIAQRTGGGIRGLVVEVLSDRIGVRGRAASFHMKQLAIQGVLDAIGPLGTNQIELDVHVVVMEMPGPDTVVDNLINQAPDGE